MKQKASDAKTINSLTLSNSKETIPNVHCAVSHMLVKCLVYSKMSEISICQELVTDHLTYKFWIYRVQ